MPAWFERTSLRCPNCDYDVAQTLEDGFAVCPECGHAIYPEECTRTTRTIQLRTRRLIYATWLLLPLSILIAIAVRQPVIVLLGLPLTLGATYASWYWIESWLEGPGAWLRAFPSTCATVLVMLLLTSLAGILMAALLAI